MSTQPIIEVNNLSKSYQLGSINTYSFLTDFKAKLKGQTKANLFHALKNVTFNVMEGEIIKYLKNGAGKDTTTILSRITEPSSGNIER